MIAGYEKRWQLEAHIEALERELRGHHYSDRHRNEIEAQLKIFRAALAEHVEDEPEGRTTGRSTLIRNNTTGRTYTEWVN